MRGTLETFIEILRQTGSTWRPNSGRRGAECETHGGTATAHIYTCSGVPDHAL